MVITKKIKINIHFHLLHSCINLIIFWLTEIYKMYNVAVILKRLATTVLEYTAVALGLPPIL